MNYNEPYELALLRISASIKQPDTARMVLKQFRDLKLHLPDTVRRRLEEIIRTETAPIAPSPAQVAAMADEDGWYDDH